MLAEVGQFLVFRPRVGACGDVASPDHIVIRVDQLEYFEVGRRQLQASSLRLVTCFDDAVRNALQLLEIVTSVAQEGFQIEFNRVIE